MVDIMLDLETLGTAPGVVVLTIGAMRFKRNGELPAFDHIDDANTFYVRINIESCVEAGLTIDESTMKWWNKQSEAAREEALEGDDRLSLNDAISALRTWVRSQGGTKYVWCQGSDFDVPILAAAAKRVGIALPWRFYNVRDNRTLLDIAGVDIKQFKGKNEFVAHHALWDCYVQAKAAQAAFAKIELGD